MDEHPEERRHPRIIRRHRVVEYPGEQRGSRLRRALGTAGVYAIGYGNVGSSIYYALGIVATYALGATPIALALAGVIFVFTAMTYAEGVAMVPTAGGSVAFARRAFNDLFSFIAGWALALNYVVTTAISAVTAAFYLSYFWPPLKTNPALAALGGMTIVALLMLLNLRGVRETARVNIGFAVIDLATQFLLVLMGISLIASGWRNFLRYPHLGPAYWPTTGELIFGVAIAMVAYVGLESAAQMAEETKVPTRTVPRALLWSVVTVIFMFSALPIVALSAMPPMELVRDWGNDPVAGIASKLPDVVLNTRVLTGRFSLSGLMLPWVAVLASTILLIAANAGILAGSRITYNMAMHRQFPGAFGRVNPRFQTPHLAILLVSGTAVGIIAIGIGARDLLLRLGSLYVFSSMLAFFMAHLSVWTLRVKEPEAPRPYMAWGNVRLRGKPISITATIGVVTTAAIWFALALSPEHSFGLVVSASWIAAGVVFYVWYRRRQQLSLTATAVPEKLSELITTVPAPRRQALTRAITHMLVPVNTREAADELARIACDIAQLYTAEITAVMAIEVPRTLPVDADLPEQTQHAQEVLAVASHVADTVYDKRIETAVLQTRSAGVAIVEYAAERHMDLLLVRMVRGRPRSRDAVYGTTVDYVVRNAPCPVWIVSTSPGAPPPAPPPR
jgi:APA family basic amino acid/polyamine antiporter